MTRTLRSPNARVGGAPPVVKVNGWESGWASGDSRIIESTGGAPAMWVTPAWSISRQMSSARIARRHTWVPATAVSAHVVHQPLQWNIGSVHK